ncbi:flagellar hook-length control protein FliK [Polymorphum gilvum]|uniref:Flagellar hook-length control protein-like C-terminal domain-containing protein n=1 Tax=Polymorphum gilvum (strain LMG 25793 / CGMCC 1.9160 / SL003B-26A1) TaxID=991905 RepID=F2J490_POLGS|nr:flagellar hook-length control protein FliK [Polymorphum gilvum]ADZ71032.1 hypothetical protein SL003B_2609 [Polymorphum gilvum SL003B-26A1]
MQAHLVTLQSPAGQMSGQASVGSPPELLPGATLTGRVSAVLGDNGLRLVLGGTMLDVRSPVSLVPGTAVTVRVEAGGTAPKLLLTVLDTSAISTGYQVRPESAAGPAAAPREGLGARAESPAAAVALFSSLSDIVRAGDPAVPAPVRALAGQILGLRLAADAPITADKVRAAVENAGNFRAPTGTAPPSPGAAAAGDLKTLLLSLTGLLRGLGAVPILSGKAPETLRPAAGLPPEPGRGPAPAPGGGGGGAAAVTAGLLARLAGEAEDALARMALNRLATGGEGTTGEASRTTAGRQSEIALDLPLALGAETAVIEMRIARDGGGRAGDDAGALGWQLRFALSLTSTGPVEAAIGLRGGTGFVTLRAEWPETVADFSARRQEIVDGFRDAGLDLEDLRIVQGTAAGRAARWSSGAAATVDRET